MNPTFLPQQVFYRNLRVYKIAEIIYDITYIFTGRFLSRGDRTIDQMVQAARSGKQNIAEGSVAGSTSKETEIKLTNVAKASLQELLIDYEDYLRVRNLHQWSKNEEKALITRRICMNNNDSAYFREAVRVRTDETVANIAIILIHQADVLLHRLIERQKSDFLKNGGIREQMTKARLYSRRQSPPPPSSQNYRSTQISQSPHSPQSPQPTQPCQGFPPKEK